MEQYTYSAQEVSDYIFFHGKQWQKEGETECSGSRDFYGMRDFLLPHNVDECVSLPNSEAV
jgi:hypothetical protein